MTEPTPGSTPVSTPVSTRVVTPFTAESTAAEVAAGIDLTGRRAVVTGASSGIGVETARALAGAGAEVTLAVRSTEAGERAAALRPLLWGLAAGLVGMASVVGLLEPALDEGSAVVVFWGLLAGALFLIASRRALEGRDVHVGKLRGAGVRRSLLVLGVLFVHSLPEGFAIGTAFASGRDGLGLFIGSRLFGVADEAIFRRICYVLIAAAVVFSLPVLDGVIR